jgi:hypothetical protein
VLDAMVETAAYVLRSLTGEEDRQLTLQLARDLQQVPVDKNDRFSTKKYEETFSLKRHQANGELRRLNEAGFITSVEGRFPRWRALEGAIAKAPAPTNAASCPLVCLRLLGDHDKGQSLNEAFHDLHDPRHFVVPPEEFRQVPKAPFCYWIGSRARELFGELVSLGSNGRKVQVGVSTKDDFRFLRLWWEASPTKLCPPSAHPPEYDGVYSVYGNFKWFPLAKGGAYSPYHSDLHLIINWEYGGREIESHVLKRYPYLGGNAEWVLHRESNYFHSGLTYPARTQIGKDQLAGGGLAAAGLADKP